MEWSFERKRKRWVTVGTWLRSQDAQTVDVAEILGDSRQRAPRSHPVSKASRTLEALAGRLLPTTHTVPVDLVVSALTVS